MAAARTGGGHLAFQVLCSGVGDELHLGQHCHRPAAAVQGTRAGTTGSNAESTTNLPPDAEVHGYWTNAPNALKDGR